MSFTTLYYYFLLLFAGLFSQLAFADEHDMQQSFTQVQQYQAATFSQQSLRLEQRYQQWRATENQQHQILSVWLRYQEQLPVLASQLRKLFPQTKAGQRTASWQKQKIAFAPLWQQYQRLLLQRKQMLASLPEAYRFNMYQLGPEGLAQLRLEGELWAVHRDYALWRLKGFLMDFIAAQKASVLPLFVALLQIGCALLLLLFWRKKIVRWCQESLQNNFDKHWKVQFLKAVIHISPPLEWAFLAYAVLLSLQNYLRLSPESIVFLCLYRLLGLLLLGRIVWLLLQKNSALFVSSMRKTLLLALAVWLLLSVLSIAVHSFAISQSLLVALLVGLQAPLLFVLMLVVLAIWRPYWLQQMVSEEFPNNRLKTLPKHWRQGWKSYALVLAAVVYLGAIRLLRFLLHSTRNSPTVNLWLAYLFRMEVVRQNAAMQDDERFCPLPGEQTQAFLPGFESSYFNEAVQAPLRENLENLVLANKASIALLHGPKGAGKSSFLASLSRSQRFGDEQIQVVNIACPTGGFSALLEQLGLHVLLDDSKEQQDISNARELIAVLKEMQRTVIVIDDLQHLVSPKIGGLDELERLMRLMRRASSEISWVLAIDTACWRFVERARGERFIFDVETMLSPWPEKAISELVLARTREAGLEVDVSQLHLPKQLSQKRRFREDDVVLRFGVIIWEYAKGNPAVALWLWSTALFVKRDKVQSPVYLRLFETRDNEELLNLSVNLLLVLRAVMQMGKASKDALASSVNLSSDEMVDALRLLRSKGFIVRSDNAEYEIHWPDFRAISLLLERQHLLAM